MKILIVSPIERFREGVTRFVRGGWGESEVHALPAIDAARAVEAPDLVLACEAALGQQPAIALLALRIDFPGARIVGLGMGRHSGLGEAALRAGADGCLHMAMGEPEFIDGIRQVVAGTRFIARSTRARPEATLAGGLAPGERAILDRLPTAVAILRQDAFLYANPAAACLLGRDLAELGGCRPWELVARRHRVAMRERTAAWLGGGEPPPPRLVVAMERPDGGEVVLDASISRVIIDGGPALLVGGIEWRPLPEAWTGAGQAPDPPAGPTGRQVEILRLVADGLSNRQIARRLGIAESTVRVHLYYAMRTLKASNRITAVAVARRLGLV